MERWAEEGQSALRALADARNSSVSLGFPTFQGFAWGHKSEKNVVQWFEHTFLVLIIAMISDIHEIQPTEYDQ